MLSEGWTILDVRPPNETKKAHVKEAVEVPLFVPDNSLDPSSLLKQMSAFGMGGWWLGGVHMKPNTNFMATVQQKVRRILVHNNMLGIHANSHVATPVL